MDQPHFSHSNLKATLADLKGDTSAMQLLAAEFVKRYPDQTLAMACAYREGDLPALVNRLHQARGALGIFRALAALEQAVMLEQMADRREAIPHEPFYRFLNSYMGLGLDLSRFLDQPELLAHSGHFEPAPAKEV